MQISFGVKVTTSPTQSSAWHEPALILALMEKLSDGSAYLHSPVSFGAGSSCLRTGRLHSVWTCSHSAHRAESVLACIPGNPRPLLSCLLLAAYSQMKSVHGVPVSGQEAACGSCCMAESEGRSPVI